MKLTDRIEKDITLKAPVSRVWRALTDSQQFGAWFKAAFDDPFVAGETVRGRITYPGYEHLKFVLTIEAVEPERRFAFRWHPNATDPDQDYGDEPTTLCEFLLTPVEGGTRLQFSESGYDALPAARRAEAFRNNDDGWNQQMDNIRAHVEG